MTTILSTQNIVDNKLEKLAKRVQKLKERTIRPKMKVVLVGENSASLVYVGIKEKTCKKLQCDFELLRLPHDVTRKEFLNEVDSMNNDPSIHGCFVQLPVPEHLQDIDVTSLINPEKDVDGFGGATIVDIYKGKTPFFLPCTPMGVLELLNHNQIEALGKRVVIIGKSLIVGRPLSLLLQNMGATVTVCHSKTQNLESHTLQADIIISAVGSPKFLTKDYFNKDLNQVVIDVGINRDHNGKLCGDVDFENVKNIVSAITPVPGGVGPLTVISLMENLVKSAERATKG
ncbi:MAG: bifunctional methylenetetrahydrofolate dehydrogenase/methenyltetrahydrofolate cyclohydrolase [Halobacteriovoraceae bacterium]|nr:bifunctional methylenetetrahydrofolate dehydrogenase/methenyltetrahydrofolate cyclohydrolase [Halobacteriovoraceae bacterium]|tara:strand:+ start:7422 stop:8282 length:861 start_codon:yes stop_codon:yes gene_type:complete